MKNLLSACSALVVFTSPLWSQTATNLAFFGTNNPSPFVSSFEVDSGFTDAPYSQADASLTLGTPFSSGQTLFGAFGSLAAPDVFDWSSLDKLALSLSATTAPTALLFVDFFASDLFTVLANAELNLASIGSTPTSVEFEFLNGTAINDLTSVSALYFVWGGDSVSGNDVTINSIQAVPEPGTWAMLIFGGVVCGIVVWRRQRRCRATAG